MKPPSHQRVTPPRLFRGNLSQAQFLRDYWQKKPLLVRGAFPKFRDPITPHELAGLACEDGVESRIVVQTKRAKKTKWDITWGPHDEKVFASLPNHDWTILVQEVNRWVPEAALLLEPFAFIPNVRVDDVMVSFAEPGGGVGPHVDSYDVFLVQGLGERRWQFHNKRTRESDRELIPNLDLRVLARFVPDIDEVLAPGDMLYLPPGFAHHGVAQTSCLTYSIGFRSPSAGEAWTSFASSVSSESAKNGSEEASRLLEDPPLKPAENPGAIPRELLARARKMIRSMDMSDHAIDRWFASFTTQLKPGHELAAPSRKPTLEAIIKRLNRGDVVVRSEEGRWAYLDEGALLYVGGHETNVESKEARALARLLCTKRRHDGRALHKHKSQSSRELLLALFTMGALHFA